MAATPFKTFFVGILCLLFENSFSQDYSPKLGPHSNNNKFRFLAEDSRDLNLKRFAPKYDNVIAYNSEGEPLNLSITDTVTNSDIYQGKWNGKSGKWISFFDNARKGSGASDFYVLLNQMKDVESEAKVSDVVKYDRYKADVDAAQIAERKAKQEIISNVYLPIGIGVLTFIALCVLINGYRRKCPECRKWFARKLINKEVLDSYSYTYNTTESVPVYSGKGYAGNANVPVTKTGYSQTYQNHYICCKCQHTWTGKIRTR